MSSSVEHRCPLCGSELPNVTHAEDVRTRIMEFFVDEETRGIASTVEVAKLLKRYDGYVGKAARDAGLRRVGGTYVFTVEETLALADRNLAEDAIPQSQSLDRDLARLNLSIRSQNALILRTKYQEPILTLQALVKLTDRDLRKRKGLGVKSWREIRAALTRAGYPNPTPGAGS